MFFFLFPHTFNPFCIFQSSTYTTTAKKKEKRKIGRGKSIRRKRDGKTRQAHNIIYTRQASGKEKKERYMRVIA